MMEWFYTYFPEIAECETRSATVTEALPGLSVGEYSFVDLYCTDPGCSCTNVVLNVMERSRGHVATINHGLEEDSFKDVGTDRTFLDPLNKQTSSSPALLKLFREFLLTDASYVERLRRHQRMIKEKINARAPKNRRPPDPFQRLIHELKTASNLRPPNR